MTWVGERASLSSRAKDQATLLTAIAAQRNVDVLRGGPKNLDRFRGRDKCNSAGYAAAASG